MLLLFTKYQSDQIKEDEIRRACSTHKRSARCIQSLFAKPAIRHKLTGEKLGIWPRKIQYSPQNRDFHLYSRTLLDRSDTFRLYNTIRFEEYSTGTRRMEPRYQEMNIFYKMLHYYKLLVSVFT